MAVPRIFADLLALPTASFVESAVADLFEKKGHEFIDLDVAVYLLDTEEPVSSARLRAIYRLRGS